MKYLKKYERYTGLNNNILSIYSKNLTEIPEEFLPLDNIKELLCYNNKLSVLPELPDTLINLVCQHNNLRYLPELPPDLDMLFCYNNKLTELNLPSKLRVLDCANNNISELQLPDGLEELLCDKNNLTELPELPDSLTTFSCGQNNFKEPIKYEYHVKFYNGIFLGDMKSNFLYTKEQTEKFKTYEFQKEFLTKDDSRWEDLKPFGINEKLKKEFSWIWDAGEMGLL